MSSSDGMIPIGISQEFFCRRPVVRYKSVLGNAFSVTTFYFVGDQIRGQTEYKLIDGNYIKEVSGEHKSEQASGPIRCAREELSDITVEGVPILNILGAKRKVVVGLLAKWDDVVHIGD